jgi:hypothetical protein
MRYGSLQLHKKNQRSSTSAHTIAKYTSAPVDPPNQWPNLSRCSLIMCFGNNSVRDVLIYCRDHHCTHHIASALTTGRMTSGCQISSICTACGKRGAEELPKFSRRPE